MESETYRDAGGKWRWRLKTDKGDTVASSGQAFSTRWSARRAVRNFTAKAAGYEFETYTDESGQHRWRATAANGEKVAASPKAYATLDGARQGADQVKSATGGEEETPENPATAADPADVGKVAGWLAVAIGVVGSAVGIIGLADADLDRAVINYPLGSSLAFLLILCGVLAGVIAPIIGRLRRSTAVSGVVMFGAGLFLLVWLAAHAKSASDRPRVTASLTKSATGLRVKGNVAAAGLEANQHVFVRIVGISTDDKLAGEHIGHPRGKEKALDRQAVYSSRTGASADGTALITLDTPVGAGLYERLDVEAVVSNDKDDPVTGAETQSCDQETSNIGCESLMVPPTARRPRLVAEWKLPATQPPVLSILARMDDLSSDDRVLLSVRRLHGHALGGRVYGASWAPDTGGAIEEKLELPVAPRREPLCVVMRSRRGSTRFASEATERFGPCGARSRGMAVRVGPIATRP